MIEGIPRGSRARGDALFRLVSRLIKEAWLVAVLEPVILFRLKLLDTLFRSWELLRRKVSQLVDDELADSAMVKWI